MINNKRDIVKLTEIARKVRLTILDIIYKTKSPHIGPSFSMTEGLVALYFSAMKNIDDSPENPNRDRFILSKGHACATLYAVLHEKGLVSKEDLSGFAVDGGVLEHHPNIDLKRGIETSSGSLGHGMSIGAGMALAAKVDGKKSKTYAIFSDGEMNEGSIWEAVMFAAHYKLSGFEAMIDKNNIQALGYTKDIINLDPLGDKFASFGWNVQDIDGHDFEAILDALENTSDEKPNVIILNTVKGKGVSFMEDELLWHYRPPDDDEYARAKRELEI